MINRCFVSSRFCLEGGKIFKPFSAKISILRKMSHVFQGECGCQPFSQEGTETGYIGDPQPAGHCSRYSPPWDKWHTTPTSDSGPIYQQLHLQSLTTIFYPAESDDPLLHMRSKHFYIRPFIGHLKTALKGGNKRQREPIYVALRYKIRRRHFFPKSVSALPCVVNVQLISKLQQLDVFEMEFVKRLYCHF